ncbi:5-oxoprolinase subunit PxpB [Undibacterium sp. FT137W]|uniref:5-oxoprolinase subunit PxpB n=1 Tax=Undibacterium fentianense TaxID=2828728 RepID=A0A941E6H8_9BURK|nr:5-oxoprolinase subunit PxpB [Undibacterium fentianense]MBR7799628.1 5-oxoprolinase subunit PxpB [Undibacterium fentianense]
MSFYLLGERAAVMQSNSERIDLRLQQQIWHISSALAKTGSCIDLVPGMNNLTAIFDPLETNGAAILEKMQLFFEQANSLDLLGREVTIPVHYGGIAGPDLCEVAAHCGLNTRELIELHTSASYLVYFLGFQPGFAYLGGLPERLNTPRRAVPRVAVPAGSVGIGGSQTGIYPATSPGGWQIIGRTKLPLFQIHRTPPSALLPGDTVRFVVENDDA